MPNSISPIFMFKLIIKTQKYYKKIKKLVTKDDKFHFIKMRGILSSFYKNQNTLKCEYYLSCLGEIIIFQI